MENKNELKKKKIKNDDITEMEADNININS